MESFDKKTWGGGLPMGAGDLHRKGFGSSTTAGQEC